MVLQPYAMSYTQKPKKSISENFFITHWVVKNQTWALIFVIFFLSFDSILSVTMSK